MFFYLNGQIPSYQAERSLASFLYGASSWVPQGTRPLFMNYWFPSLMFLFCIIGWLMGHICSCSLCSWACSLEMSQSQLGPVTYPKDPKPLGILRYPSSTFLFGFPAIFPLRSGLSFSFLCFVRPKACPLVGLGPFLLTFSEFGPCPFLESPSGS